MDDKRTERLVAILKRKRKEAIEEIESDLGENISENTRFQLRNVSDILDKAKLSVDFELNYQVLQQKCERLKLIEESLNRLHNGQYGLCSDCGEPIDEKRLLVLPFALHCIECQKAHETGRERPTL